MKRLLRGLPVTFSKNQRYDRLTERIIRTHLRPGDNCVDVGAHRGEIFELFLKQSPAGRHFAFEPIPDLFKGLQKKYGRYSNCSIFQLALANKSGYSTFNYVITNPAYSGIRKRRYDRKNEQDTQIEVRTARMDDVIPADIPIHFIKIDVEGGEMDVLRGAQRVLSSYRPIIVFECGLGGSDIYGTTPQDIYSFFEGLQYRISLLDDFVNRRSALSLPDFVRQFEQNENYYFVAHSQE